MQLREFDFRALDILDTLLDGVTAEDLARPTPCAGWDLGDLLRHQISENHGFAAAARDGVATDWDTGNAHPDPIAGYASSVAEVKAAFAEDGVAERKMAIHDFGTFDAEMALSMHLVDQLAHGWDIARALGLPYAPDEDLVAAAMKLVELIPAGAENRGDGQSFGLVVETGADASTLDRMLGLLGRDPAWRVS
ncbi:TIGR03086 family metal-binding protein [Amycolatopsis minnesotensis]|uniref:TIGR03086 family metal-binding protein n=1 Tax=Amycolatopsis minnesotensis TaxID=337894 RepID=A0ABP5CL15_9PSEU